MCVDTTKPMAAVVCLTNNNCVRKFYVCVKYVFDCELSFRSLVAEAPGIQNIWNRQRSFP